MVSLTTAEVGRDPRSHPCDPAGAVVGLLRAVAAILACWCDSQGAAGFGLGGRTTAAVSGQSSALPATTRRSAGSHRPTTRPDYRQELTTAA